MHAVPHGWLVCLLLGMSFAYVHGFGFIPENKTLKILFSPLVAWPLMIVGATMISL
jgi:putative cyd operon protein ybgE